MYEGNDEAEPDWVKNEREQFVNFRDTNKDGVMDKEEVKAWIIPPDYDHSEAEAKHLISQSDGDNVRVSHIITLLYFMWYMSQRTPQEFLTGRWST